MIKERIFPLFFLGRRPTPCKGAALDPAGTLSLHPAGALPPSPARENLPCNPTHGLTLYKRHNLLSLAGTLLAMVAGNSVGSDIIRPPLYAFVGDSAPTSLHLLDNYLSLWYN